VTPRLALRAVEARPGPRRVLTGVALDVAPGEIVGLLGRNGAGKTTLLRVAGGLLPAAGGTVSLDGRPLEGWPRRARARAIALVPQETHFAFPFTVAEVVLMGRTPYLGWLGFEREADLAAARRAMESLEIGPLADRPVSELSGGERQLAVVARALAQEPRLLLLDEPTAFLDLRHRLAVLARVREFAAAGGSALVVSHDLSIAARACHRVALLASGRILAAGAPHEVLTAARLREAFGIEADVTAGPDGLPVVIPRSLAAE
jgi:iron complex transport system ATP-binding protein